jgi:hypothetical protein
MLIDNSPFSEIIQKIKMLALLYFGLLRQLFQLLLCCILLVNILSIVLEITYGIDLIGGTWRITKPAANHNNSR